MSGWRSWGFYGCPTRSRIHSWSFSFCPWQPCCVSIFAHISPPGTSQVGLEKILVKAQCDVSKMLQIIVLSYHCSPAVEFLKTKTRSRKFKASVHLQGPACCLGSLDSEISKDIKTIVPSSCSFESHITVKMLLLAIAAFSTRLFAVLRFESVIHEFDP